MEHIVRETIAEFLIQTIKQPLSYFSEKSLQVKLTSMLMQHSELTTPVRTKISDKYKSSIDKIVKDREGLLDSLAIQPLQMEYGVDIDGKPYRMDIAILEQEKIEEINEWDFQQDKKYIRPLIGIEIGTEKSGWEVMSVKHLDNDETKLLTAQHGYILNIMRNSNVCYDGSLRWNNKDKRIDTFREALKKKASQSGNITWVGIINHIAYQEVEFLTVNNVWKTYDITTQLYELEKDIYELLQKSTPTYIRDNRLSVEDIVRSFKKEFSRQEHLFTIIQAPTNQGVNFKDCQIFENGQWVQTEVNKILNNETIARPGVYVIWKQDPTAKSNVIKVGRHLENSRMRAFQHFQSPYPAYDTRNLPNDLDAKILLFNVKNPNDRHWVAALEIFFELNLNPIVRACKLG